MSPGAVESPLRQRRPALDATTVEPRIYPQDPVASHVVNALHLLLPEGERWFCRVYGEAEARITDRRLRADVRAFIRQEGTHAAMHARVVKMLAEHGYEPEGTQEEMRWLFRTLLGDAPLGAEARRDSAPDDWLLQRVGIIAAIEHMTGVLGTWVLEAEALDSDDPGVVAPRQRELLRWHGAEEVEHRDVALDLYEHLGGRPGMRVVQMALVFPILMACFGRYGARLLARDPDVLAGRVRAPRTIAGVLWRVEREGRATGRLPTVSWLFREALDYTRRDYRPDGRAAARAAAELASIPLVGGPATA